MNEMDKEVVILTSKLKRSWGWLLTLGIVFVVLGMLGVGMSAWITEFSMFFIAVILFVAGFSQLADALNARYWQAVIWHIAIALLYMIAAALISYDPQLASELLTAVLAWIFIFIGISRLVMFFNLYRIPGWGWLFLSSIASIALGVLILLRWPMSGEWFIGLMIAIELMVSGWTYILMALALRKM